MPHLHKEELKIKYTADKNYQKVRNHSHYTGNYRGAAHSICNLKYSISMEIPVVFHSGSNYDYHFVVKELVKEYEGWFIYLGENTEKYKTFSRLNFLFVARYFLLVAPYFLLVLCYPADTKTSQRRRKNGLNLFSKMS